ncbi:hypothetical protein RhiLY_02366 [Ceratobasidium sp. AG-Ba]|nr:hypothetical protein RhiLY_02366 [Ceratobasidium sp. AG-Ba]
MTTSTTNVNAQPVPLVLEIARRMGLNMAFGGLWDWMRGNGLSTCKECWAISVVMVGIYGKKVRTVHSLGTAHSRLFLSP